MSDTLKLLGKLVEGNPPRDAVHIAVVPVTARDRLRPGERVAADGAAAQAGLGVGIVDPFLPEPVEPGQRFWLWLDPGSITALVHHWTHPAFPVTTADEVNQAIKEYLERKKAQA